MLFNRVPLSFGRVFAADDSLLTHPRSPRPLRSADRRTADTWLRAVVVVAALGCGLPLTTLAQHHRNSRGHGSQDQLSALTCGSGSLTGAGTDACTVTLTQAASSGGFTVDLSSSSSSVKVPASVAVASGATSAKFTATASAVTSAKTVTLKASDSNNSETYSLKLNPGSSATASLKLGSSSVAFGNVSVNTPATQTVQLTSSGTASLNISAASIKGTGFTMSGVTTPVTLSPGQSATLDLKFDPTAAGSDTGTVTISSNASGGTATIALTGTGTTSSAYEVELSWKAPGSSSDAVAGYNIYRATSGGTYQKLNTAVNPPTSYTDTSAQSGTTYTYEVMSVDSAGVQSAASNVYSAAIP